MIIDAELFFHTKLMISLKRAISPLITRLLREIMLKIIMINLEYMAHSTELTS